VKAPDAEAEEEKEEGWTWLCCTCTATEGCRGPAASAREKAAMLAIRLPQSIEKRLEKFAGRTKTFYVREAIQEHLEEIEDLYLAQRALKRIRSGEERTIPLK
jgi:RHH-type rel operon transcriptional repressor/antitoxin RelB